MKKLYINGEIIPDDDQWMYDLLEMSATSHKKVKSFVDESGTDDLEIYINSPGGSVHAGSAIYDELRAYKGKTTAYITGIAASAATLIMLGAQKSSLNAHCANDDPQSSDVQRAITGKWSRPPPF